MNCTAQSSRGEVYPTDHLRRHACVRASCFSIIIEMPAIGCVSQPGLSHLPRQAGVTVIHNQATGLEYVQYTANRTLRTRLLYGHSYPSHPLSDSRPQTSTCPASGHLWLPLVASDHFPLGLEDVITGYWGLSHCTRPGGEHARRIRLQ